MNIVFRTYHSEKDCFEMVRIRKQNARHDKVDPHSTLENIPSYEEINKSLREDNCDPFKDILIVEDNNEVIGYSKIGWWKENDGTWLYLHKEYLLARYRSNGIFAKMLQWSENRIKEIAKANNNSKKAEFGSNATSSEVEATKLLLDNNYKKVFSLVEMRLDNEKLIETNNIPKGFVIRPVGLKNTRLIWETNNVIYSNRDYITTPTEHDYYEFANNSRSDFDLWVVAWSGKEIAGFVISEVQNGYAEIKEVSVVENYRRNSLASYLLKENILRLKKKGAKEIRLHTNSENIVGARLLYEKVGFVHVKDFNRYRRQF